MNKSQKAKRPNPDPDQEVDRINENEKRLFRDVYDANAKRARYLLRALEYQYGARFFGPAGSKDRGGKAPLESAPVASLQGGSLPPEVPQLARAALNFHRIVTSILDKSVRQGFKETDGLKGEGEQDSSRSVTSAGASRQASQAATSPSRCGSSNPRNATAPALLARTAPDRRSSSFRETLGSNPAQAGLPTRQPRWTPTPRLEAALAAALARLVAEDRLDAVEQGGTENSVPLAIGEGQELGEGEEDRESQGSCGQSRAPVAEGEGLRPRLPRIQTLPPRQPSPEGKGKAGRRGRGEEGDTDTDSA